MKQYGVLHKLTGLQVAGPFDGLTQTHALAKSLGPDFRTVTWIGFLGLPAIAAIFRRVGDVDVLETACLYRTEADRICAEMGGEAQGFFVRTVMLNTGYQE